MNNNSLRIFLVGGDFTAMRICMTADETKELSSMSNLSEGIMEEGIRIGREEGREINTVDNLKSLMETLGLSLSQAMSALKIPPDKVSHYEKLIKKTID